MAFADYDDFKNAASSEKVSLVIVEAAKRLVGWVSHDGDVYKITSFDFPVIVSITEDGTALTEVSSLGAVAAEKFYHDRANQTLYMETTGSVDPNTVFIAMIFKNFYSNVGVKAAYDLSTGFSVEWLPMVLSTSQFGVQIDNKDTQLGFAIEGSGTVELVNDLLYWKNKYDKWIFENKRVFVYNWNRTIDISEARLIYRGRIQGKSFNQKSITFKLKDLLNELRAPIPMDKLRAPIPMDNMSEHTYTHSVLGSISARITDSQLNAKQRHVYGYISGYRPINIDQVLNTGYPLQGTATVTNGSQTVTGASTSWPTELFQGDSITFGTNEIEYTVETFTDATTLTLSEPYAEGSNSGLSMSLFPQRQRQSVNRYFLIAGHELTKPATTITTVYNARRFQVDDATDFRIGDTVEINGDVRSIRLIADSDIMHLTTDLSVIPSETDDVERSPISSAHIDDKQISIGTDFTYDEETALLKLKSDAADHPEFRIAPILALSGTLATSTASLTVTGTGTDFNAELKPGDWVRIPNQSAWRQVWSITSETSLILTAVAGYTESTTVTVCKKPAYFKERSSVLSIDVIGKSDDGQSTGSVLYRAPEIVKDILTTAGLGSLLNDASFSAANNIAEHRIGLAIPKKWSDRKAPKLRDVINKINKSVFGSLFQNNSFKLEYALLDPAKPTSYKSFDRADTVSFDITSAQDKLVKTVNLRYNFKEWNYKSSDDDFSQAVSSSDISTYLAEITREFDIDTYLVDETSATIFAARWSFLLELASTSTKISTKLQGSELEINDIVAFSHPGLFNRIGSQDAQKIGLVQKIERDHSRSIITITDLANAFSRVAMWSPNTANDHDVASTEEKLLNGYWTDSGGMINNDEDTYGINVFW